MIQGSSQLREATTAKVMLAVMPIEIASERRTILAIFQRDMSHPLHGWREPDSSVSYCRTGTGIVRLTNG
jgi:hypothetical protein